MQVVPWSRCTLLCRLCTLSLAVVLSGLTEGCATEDIVKKSDGYYQQGLADLNVDQQRAYVLFQKAIELNPDHRGAHYYVGHVHFLQGRLEKAEAEFREVLRIDPEYPEAHNHLDVPSRHMGSLEIAPVDNRHSRPRWKPGAAHAANGRQQPQHRDGPGVPHLTCLTPPHAPWQPRA